MKKWLLILGCLVSTSVVAQTKEIKLATIAPAGSSWDNITTRMNEVLKARSGGKLAFRVYPGGTQGDEKDVIRKMRIGQIHAGGFTGNGLGMVSPAFRVLEIPFLYKSAEDIDYVEEKMRPEMEALFLKGNPPVVLLGWAEAGSIYIYSNRPVRSLKDLQGMKVWQWEGDPLAAETFKNLGVTPIPLAVTDVMTALSTNMIEAAYAPPLGALALQWVSKVKYMTDLSVTSSLGGLVMLKSEYDKLSPDQQKILKEVTTKYCREIVTQTRRDNLQSIEEIKRLGIQVITPETKDTDEFIAAAKKTWVNLVGKLYSQDQLNRVQALVAESQGKKPSASAQLH